MFYASRFLLGAACAAMMLGGVTAAAEPLPRVSIVNPHGILGPDGHIVQSIDLYDDAADFLGAVAVSYQMLDLVQMDLAGVHLREARAALSDLTRALPTPVISGEMTFARTAYAQGGNEKDLLLAVADDELAVDDYDDVVRRRANIGFVVKDSEALRYRFEINVPLALNALNAAIEKNHANDAPGAMAALETLYRGALSGPVPYATPWQAAHENMAVALDFIDNGSFHEARHALGHAATVLAAYKTHPAGQGHAAAIDRIHDRIGGLQAALSREDRRALRRAEDQVEDWLDIIKSWGVPHNELRLRPVSYEAAR